MTTDTAARPASYSELMASAAAICEAQPGYGTPDYRGDPPEAVALHKRLTASSTTWHAR